MFRRKLSAAIFGGVLAVGAAMGLAVMKGAYDAAYVPMEHIVIARSWPRVGQDVAALAFSPDDLQIAASDTQNALHVLRMPRLRETVSIPTRRRETVTTLAWTSDGGRVLAGDASGMSVWNVSNRTDGVLLHPNAGTGSIQGLVQEPRYLVSPSGEFAAGGRDNTTLSIWNLQTRRSLLLSIPEAVRDAAVPSPWDDPNAPWERSQVKFPLVALAFSPDSRLLAVAFVRYHPSFTLLHSTICLFDTASGRLIRSWLWRDSATVNADLGETALAFSPDGALLAGRDDEKIAVWDTETGAKRRTIKCTARIGGQKCLAFVPGTPLLACSSFSDNAEIWNTKTGRLERTVHGPKFTHSLAVSHDGRLLATGGQTAAGDGVIDLWDISRQKS